MYKHTELAVLESGLIKVALQQKQEANNAIHHRY